MYGGIGKGLLVTMVDRRSRFLVAGVIRNRNAVETANSIIEKLRDLPVHSISLDNGSEFADFKRLENELHTQIFFAQPHKPWQRGTNENTNDILRFFYPKGCDLRSLTDRALQTVVDSINARPRKCLGWHTPAEIFEKGVALA